MDWTSLADHMADWRLWQAALPELWPLGAAAFGAGLIDAIGGGGGLITMPALLLLGIPGPYLLGTNKGLSCLGSIPAAVRYARAGLIPKLTGTIWAGAVAGTIAMAAFGARLSQAPAVQRHFALLVPVLLVAAMVFMIKHWFWDEPRREREAHGEVKAASHALTKPANWLPLAGVAAYDGLFGPGTGTLFLSLFERNGVKTVAANAVTKVFNLSSNVGALLVFAFSGKVLWPLCLAAGLCYQCGGYLGAGLVLKRGQKMVRVVVLVATTAVLSKWIAQQVV